MFANDGFKIRGWDETGLHVGSACSFGGSIGTLVTSDADVARKPAEVNEFEWGFYALSLADLLPLNTNGGEVDSEEDDVPLSDLVPLSKK